MGSMTHFAIYHKVLFNLHCPFNNSLRGISIKAYLKWVSCLSSKINILPVFTIVMRYEIYVNVMLLLGEFPINGPLKKYPEVSEKQFKGLNVTWAFQTSMYHMMANATELKLWSHNKTGHICLKISSIQYKFNPINIVVYSQISEQCHESVPTDDMAPNGARPSAW